MRFRINGQATVTEHGIQLQVGEAYGNCPKYIQKRSMEKASHEASVSHREGEILQQDLVDWILAADTFFVSSSDGGKRVDASHRGGNPGFVQVLPDGVLKIPDYQGNSMFNTLGNLAQHPKAGLLFVDFKRGSTLQLTGTTELEFDQRSPEDMQRTTGTGRYWLFRPTRWIVTEGHHGGKWGEAEYSPYNS